MRMTFLAHVSHVTTSSDAVYFFIYLFFSELFAQFPVDDKILLSLFKLSTLQETSLWINVLFLH